MLSAVTFDCYGTLIDWESGFKQAVREILKGRSETPPIDPLWEKWRQTERSKCQGPYKPYHTIVAESFEEALGDLGFSVKQDDGNRIVQRFSTWGPFPDVSATLKVLKGRFRLFIISNCDDELLNLSLLKTGIQFDGTMTATRARVYKPHPDIFRKAIEVLQLDPPQTLHVAVGGIDELKTARELGFQVAWLKRSEAARHPGIEPDYTVPSLSVLLELLG